MFLVRKCMPLIILLSFMVAIPASAQTGTIVGEPQSVKIAGVNIGDCTLVPQEQDTQPIRVICAVVNNFKAQGDIRYGLQIVQRHEQSMQIFDTYVFPDTLSIAENGNLSIVMEYTPPAYLEGSYEVWAILKTSDALPLGQNLVGTIELARGDGAYALLDPSSCRVFVKGEETPYRPEHGVDIDRDEVLMGACTIEAVGGSIAASPAFIVYNRTVFGEQVLSTISTSTRVILQDGKKKEFSFTIPKAEKPQAYDALLVLVDENGSPVSNKVIFHYVVRGTSATIQNVLLNKDYYAAGDTAEVSLSWTGSADDFIGSRKESTETPVASVAFSLADASGNTCADEKTFEVEQGEDSAAQSGFGIKTYSLPVRANCTNPTVTARVIGVGGETLAESTVKIATVNTAKTMPLSRSAMLIIMSSLSALIAAYLILMFFRRKKPTDFNSLGGGAIKVCICLGVFGAGLLLNAGHASADTFSVSTKMLIPNTSIMDWGNFNYSISTNKSTYAPGESILVSGTLTGATCGNGVSLGSGIFGTNNPTGQADHVLTGYSVAPCYQSGGQLFCTTNIGQTGYRWYNGVSTPGAYTFSFIGSWIHSYIDTAGVLVNNQVWGTFPIGNLSYTVASSPPTCSLTASPSSISSGGSTNISWTVTNASSVYIYENSSSFYVDTFTPNPSPITRSRTAYPATSATYSGNVYGPGGSASCSTAYVSVSAPAPSTPTGLTATALSCGTNAISLSWSPASGASSYGVYDAISGSPIASAFTNSYTYYGSPGQYKSFYVRSISASGVQSGNSSTAWAYVPSACVITVNGACGATNNACAAGTWSDQADTSTQYLWSCVGSGGGSTASCSAPITVAVNGACGVTKDTCSAGVYSEQADDASYYYWSCLGQNGGTSAGCSVPVSKPNLVAGDVYSNGDLYYTTAAEPHIPSVTVGVPVELKAVVMNQSAGTNTGIGFTNLFQIDADADHSAITTTRTWDAPALAYGGSFYTNPVVSYTFPSTGTWYLRACADKRSTGDVNGVIDEGTNEGDNCKNWTPVTVQPVTTGLPDLTAGAITPTRVLTGIRVFSANITNQGDGPSSGFNNYFQFDLDEDGTIDAKTTTDRISGLLSGQSAVTTATISFASAGHWGIRACADMRETPTGLVGDIDEGTNEGNNCGPWTTIDVVSPDLTITDFVSIDPSPATVGTPTALSVSVQNIGSETTSTSFTNLFQITKNLPAVEDAILKREVSSPPVTAGGSTVISVAKASFYFPTLGDWFVRACADSDSGYVGTINESPSEDNNCGPWTNINVSGGGPGVPPAPTNFTATAGACGSNAIYLDWDDMSGAENYSLYYNVVPDSAWIVVPSNFSFTAGNPGTTYSFFVRSNASSKQSGNSSSVSAVFPSACSAADPIGCARPASVGSFAASKTRVKSGATVTISWSNIITENSASVCSVQNDAGLPPKSITTDASCNVNPSPDSIDAIITKKTTFKLVCDGTTLKTATVDIAPSVEEF